MKDESNGVNEGIKAEHTLNIHHTSWLLPPLAVAIVDMMGAPVSSQDLAFFAQVGQKLRHLRQARGWTLDQTSQAAGMALQNYARIEKGQNLTLAMVLRLAKLFAVVPHELLMPSEDVARPELDADPMAYLRALGWRQVEEHSARALPVLDLQAEAGWSPHHGSVRSMGWLRPPTTRRLTREGLFLARARGDSMVPLVPDGAWCLFQAPVVPPLVRKIVLLQLRNIDDPDDGGGYQLKRVGSVETAADGDGPLRIRLDSLNRAVRSVVVEVADETALEVRGELVEVLGPRPTETPHSRRRG